MADERQPRERKHRVHRGSGVAGRRDGNNQQTGACALVGCEQRAAWLGIIEMLAGW
jgi:hypothetical protein